MSITDYLVDSALVLLVLLQIKERPLTNRAFIRPIIIVSIAVVSYFNSLPTAGNDLVLIVVLAAFGALLGLGAAQATFVRRRPEDGVVVSRAGWLAGFLWVLGMGLRFGFLVWINHSGAPSLAHFSATHSITGAAAWTDALLAMAVFEVVGRSGVLFLRRNRVRAGLATGAELA
jgi:hypothetical protein